MNKTLSIERTWQFVQYEPLHISDTITDIPNDIVTNQEAIKLLRYLQLVDLEWSYIKYVQLKLSEPKIMGAESVSVALDFIENERTRTFQQLLDTINQTEEGE